MKPCLMIIIAIAASVGWILIGAAIGLSKDATFFGLTVAWITYILSEQSKQGERIKKIEEQIKETK